MCGRFVSSNTPDRIASYFGASFDTEPLGENYNVAPTNDIYAVVQPEVQPDVQSGDPIGDAASVQPAIRAFHWGLVPSWAKNTKIGSKMINARAETLSEKPVFKKLLVSRRVIIPMDGFYEWQVVAGQKTKQPMFIHRRDGEPLAVAGLWSRWRDPTTEPDPSGTPGTEQRWLHSCTIITTAANATMAPIHDRMPVLLPATRWNEWLDPSNHDIESLVRLLVPAPDELLIMHPVSTTVNNVRNNGPELLDPVEHLASAGSLFPPS
jgi:putative SOS response-associated peptidase YedK